MIRSPWLDLATLMASAAVAGALPSCAEAPADYSPAGETAAQTTLGQNNDPSAVTEGLGSPPAPSPAATAAGPEPTGVQLEASPLASFTFEAGVQGWTIPFAFPATLQPVEAPEVGGSTVQPEGTLGDPDPGAVRLDVPFSGSPSPGAEHKLHLQVNLPGGPADLSSRTMAVRLYIEPGGFVVDPLNPGGVKFFMRSGDAGVYADMGFQNYDPSNVNWRYYSATSLGNPAYQDPGFDVGDVRSVGLEFSSGALSELAPAVIYVDSFQIY